MERSERRRRALWRPGALPLRALVCLLAACGDHTHTVGVVEEDLIDEQPTHAREQVPESEQMTDAAQAGTSSTESSEQPPPSSSQPPDVEQVDDPPSQPQDDQWDDPPLTIPVVETNCRFEAEEIERKRLDMYLMVDSAITLPFSGAWDNVTEGITGYVNDERAEGTGVGIRLFGLQCTADSYTQPGVRIATLPDNAQAIALHLPQLTFNASPVLPALEGAIMHTQERAETYPSWKPIVVLITDGALDPICNSDEDDLFAAARAGFAGEPSIPTYVIALQMEGVTVLPDTLARLLGLDALDQLAASGGTGRAWTIEVGDPSQTLTDALLDIQRDAETCEFMVEEGTDESQWALGIDDGATQLPLRRVESLGGCIGGGGYYLVDGAESSRWAVLCPTTCGDIKAHDLQVIGLRGCEL